MSAALGESVRSRRVVAVLVSPGANRTIVRFTPLPSPNGTTTVMAYDVTFMQLSYYDSNAVLITDPAQYDRAERVRIEIRVELPATMGTPASVVGLVSDVALRNAPSTLQQF